MTTIAMPLSTKISLESNKKTSFKQIAARFGDGYEQVAPDGLNNKFDTWDLVWGGLSSSDYNTIKTALESVGTWGILTWVPCDETVMKKFRLTGDISYSREGVAYKVTCTVRQVFDV